MNVRNTLVAMSLLVLVPLSGHAGSDSLGSPIVELMPHLKQLRPTLQLTDRQNSVIDAWIAEAPAKRKQMEGELLELRAQMRESILDNRSRLVREQLKAEIADKHSRLIEMRALCTRMLRSTLTPEQFAQVVKRYREHG